MNVTSDGKLLIQNWLAAKDRHEQAGCELNRAYCEVSNAESALAKWMLPPDAKPGEKIAVWFGDSLIQVEMGGVVSGDKESAVQDVSQTKVTVRHRGKNFSDLR